MRVRGQQELGGRLGTVSVEDASDDGRGASDHTVAAIPERIK